MNVIFYEKEDGTIPIVDFMATLDSGMRAKVARTLKLLQARGYTLRAPHSKELADGIMELRIISHASYISSSWVILLLSQTVLSKNHRKRRLKKCNVPNATVQTIKGGISNDVR